MGCCNATKSSHDQLRCPARQSLCRPSDISRSDGIPPKKPHLTSSHFAPDAPVHAAKRRAARDSSVARRDFLDLEVRWLTLAQSYEFSEKLANQINDRDVHTRYVSSILRCAGANFIDSISIGCMTRAFIEIVKAVSLTGAEKPFSNDSGRADS
jgi:hypothetical protein